MVWSYGTCRVLGNIRVIGSRVGRVRVQADRACRVWGFGLQ